MSSVKTINYNNPLDFTFDSNEVEMTLDAQLKKLALSSNELSVFTGYHQKDADRFASTGIMSLVGNAVYDSVNKRYDLNDSASGMSISVGDFPVGSVLTSSFKIRFNYTGSPAGLVNILSTGDSTIAGGAGSSLWAYHSPTGSIFFKLVDSTNSSAITKDMGAFSPVAGQIYDFEISTSMATGLHYLFIDGVLINVTAPTSLPFAVRDYFRIGIDAVGATSASFTIEDISIHDVVQHTADFSADIPRNVPIYHSEGGITSLDGTLTDGFISISDDIDTPNGSAVRYASLVNDVLKYVSGGALLDSDGTSAQTNTIAEILANLDVINAELENGAVIKMYTMLITGAGQKTTPVARSTTFEYSFYSEETIPNVCTVWGYVYDGEAPVSGATITFKSEKGYFFDGTMISINKSITSRATGYYEIDIPETTTDKVAVNVEISFVDSLSKTQKKKISIIVPDQDSARIDTIGQ